MRAFVVKELTHPSNISLSTGVPEPTAGPGQVLVDVYSAGLNFFEILQAQGKYQTKPPLPFTLGSEFAGRISDNSPIPTGCTLKRGQRVFGAQLGSFADKVAVGLEQLLPLPDNLSYDQGAGIYVTWPTSYEGLVGRANLAPGEWVLVTAAAGGVGLAAVQIAKALGAKVIAAAGSPQKMEIAKRLGGADYVINYSKPGWQKEVLALTNDRGVDVIYDPVGMINGTRLSMTDITNRTEIKKLHPMIRTDSLKCIAWKGRAIVVGFAAGTIEKVPMNLVLLKNISLVGVHWGRYSLKEPSHIPTVWKDLLSLFASGRVTPVTYDKVYPLEKLTDGLVALEKRQTWAKVVVRVREEKTNISTKL